MNVFILFIIEVVLWKSWIDVEKENFWKFGSELEIINLVNSIDCLLWILLENWKLCWLSDGGIKFGERLK